MEGSWGCRVSSSSSSAAASMHATKFYSEGDNAWEYFPCPFCYVDVEVPVLCTHLQEEHCFDTRNAVCPVCAENLGKDMTSHFTVQHSHMLKRRKPQKNSLWPNGPVPIEKDPHELAYFPGNSLNNRRGGNAPDAAPDPLLLSFISYPDSADDHQEANTDVDTKGTSTKNEQSLTDLKEMSERANFFQQMLLSTIF